MSLFKENCWCGDVQSRIQAITGLEQRILTAEGTLDAHESSITSLEARFGAGKAQALDAVAASPSGGVVSILGIEVPTGAAFSNLISVVNAIKASHNDLISRSKSWGWMAS
jgi:hypothetical protein